MNSKITFDTIEELYRVTKTDRYTQDAYQVGEISRKTGLQKQSDGTWAPPKNGSKKGIRTSGGEAHKEGSLYREDPAKLATQARKEGNLKKAEFYENEANKEKAAPGSTKTQLSGKPKKPDGEHRTDRQIAREAGYSVYRDGESRNGDYREYRNGDDIIRYDQNGYDDRAEGKKYSAMESGPGGKRRFFNSLREAADWIKKGSPRESAPEVKEAPESTEKEKTPNSKKLPNEGLASTTVPMDKEPKVYYLDPEPVHLVTQNGAEGGSYDGVARGRNQYQVAFKTEEQARKYAELCELRKKYSQERDMRNLGETIRKIQEYRNQYALPRTSEGKFLRDSAATEDAAHCELTGDTKIRVRK